MRYSPHPQFDAMISHFFALLQRYGLRLEAIMLAIKAVVQSEAVVTALGGCDDFVAFAMQEIKSLTLAQVTREKVLDTLTEQVTEVGKAVCAACPICKTRPCHGSTNSCGQVGRPLIRTS